ncbi:MAG: carboxypeptidase regulatory-like domain-containing protein [Planctomycetota bacterium]
MPSTPGAPLKERAKVLLLLAALALALAAGLALLDPGNSTATDMQPDLGVAAPAKPAADDIAALATPDRAEPGTAPRDLAEEPPIPTSAPRQDVRASGAPPIKLTGVVVDPTGRPIAGAAVSAAHDLWSGRDQWESDEAPLPPIASSLSGSDGTFELNIDGAEAPMIVAAEAEGRPSVDVAGCKPGDHVRLVLGRGATVQGTVTVNSLGAPVEGATVRVHHGEDGDRVATVKTDAAGLYRAEGLIPGEGGLLVDSDAYAMPRWRDVPLEEGDVLTVNVEVEAGWTLEGTVRDAVTGDPVAKARVSAWSFIGKTAATNEQGRYRLEGVRKQLGTVVADAPGYGESEVSFDGPSKTLDLTLRRARTITGRVEDSDGAPLAGAIVTAAGSQNEGRLQRSEWSSTRTDEAGAYTLGGLRADVQLFVEARAVGFGARLATVPSPPGGSGDAVLRPQEIAPLVLQRQALVTGYVVDSGDNPIPRAYLQLSGPKEAMADRPDASDHFGRITGTADADGRFHFAGLSAGTWQLFAREPDGRAVRVDFTLAPGEALRGVQAKLPEGRTLAGRVLDEEGHGIERAFVALFPDDPEQSARLQARTDDAGAFEIEDVPEGLFKIKASGPGDDRSGTDSAAPVVRYLPTVLAGVRADGALIDLTLHRLDARVRGRVVDESGAGVPLAFVSVAIEGFDIPWAGVLANEQGRFEINVRGSGSTSLIAWRTAKLAQDTKHVTGEEWRLGRDILDDSGPAARGTVQPGTQSVELRTRY